MMRIRLVGPLSGGSRVAWFLALAVLLSLACDHSSATAAAHPGPVKQGDQVEQGERPGPPKADPDRGKRRLRGRLDEGEMEALISVASDISPEWASSLKARMAEDPDSAKADFREHGRRLFGLLMLKRRNPDLYTIRVAELALKKGISDQAVVYHQLLAKDPEAASELGGRLREMVKESVDLELRARAMELEALDKAVRELRQELLSEVNDRQQRVDALWKTLIETPSTDAGENKDPFGGFGDEERPGRLPGRRPSGGRDRGEEGEAG